MKRITVLGSTGSIGTQTLDVIRENADAFRVEALTAGSNRALLLQQIEAFHPAVAALADSAAAAALWTQLRAKGIRGTEVLAGADALETVARGNCDIVVNALMGLRGLAPTLAAIRAGKDVALANKESLVAGGQLVMEAVHACGVRLLPVDSEHSAIFQCLSDHRQKGLKRILLTASGGPFLHFDRDQLRGVTAAQALRHPNWSMGRKITIDSATMMNKGLEVIEAMWLFQVPASRIQVVVHPQSVIHSMVEFSDGSVLAQLGRADMRIPIRVALGYPDRLCGGEAAGFDVFGQRPLTFEPPDMDTFRCLALAYEAARLGGSYPVALNGANEVLVELFLEGRLTFLDIQETLERVLTAHRSVPVDTLEAVLAADAESRRQALALAPLR